MKIGKIKNVRCSEPTDETYVIVPEGITQEEFEGAVRLAKREYEDVIAETPLYARDFPVALPTIAELRKMSPETTVQEILDERDRAEQRRKEREELLERKRRSFGYYLERHGLPLVQSHPHALEITADWGHRHGQRIRYDGFSSPYYEWWNEDEGNALCDEAPDAEEA